MLTIGIDDAGRGPIIGPMILAGALFDENSISALKKLNVKDSKLLSHPTRVSLSKIIKESSLSHYIVSSSPEEIDSSIQSGINLNTLEAIKTAQIINYLNDKKKKIKVIVDCPSVNTEAWKATLLKYVEYSSNLDIRCEHKADLNHVEAGAASILAKVEREDQVSKLKKQYGNIGSGYPSDPDTKIFLREKGKELSDSGIFRKSWATWKNLFPGNKQSSLNEFLLPFLKANLL